MQSTMGINKAEALVEMQHHNVRDFEILVFCFTALPSPTKSPNAQAPSPQRPLACMCARLEPASLSAV